MEKLFGSHQVEKLLSIAENRERVKERKVAQLYESFINNFSENIRQMFFYETNNSENYATLRGHFEEHEWSEEERETIELFAFFAIKKFVDALDNIDDEYQERHGTSLLTSHDVLKTETSVGHDVMHFFTAYLHTGSLDTALPNFLSVEHNQMRSQGGTVGGAQAVVEELEVALFSASHRIQEWAELSKRRSQGTPQENLQEAVLEDFLRELSSHSQIDLGFEHLYLAKSIRKNIAPKIKQYILDFLSKESEDVLLKENKIPFDAVQFFTSSLRPELENLRTFYSEFHK